MTEVIVRSDPRGHRAIAQPPGRWRLLTPRQQAAIWAVPVLGATVQFVRGLHAIDGNLTPFGCREAARACAIASLALDLHLERIDGAPIDTLTLFGQVTVTTRDTARDLRRYAEDATGRWDVIIPPPYQDRLAEAERYDPARPDNVALPGWLERFVILLLDNTRYREVHV